MELNCEEQDQGSNSTLSGSRSFGQVVALSWGLRHYCVTSYLVGTITPRKASF